jgi:hypothetical protein
MPRPMFMTKPSEPLGVSFTLRDLLLRVARAAETYGLETKIYGYNQNNGIALHIHFPDGVAPHVTFTQLEVHDPDLQSKDPV